MTNNCSTRLRAVCVHQRLRVSEAFVTHVLHMVDVAETVQAVHEALLAILVDLGERQRRCAQS